MAYHLRNMIYCMSYWFTRKVFHGKTWIKIPKSIKKHLG